MSERYRGRDRSPFHRDDRDRRHRSKERERKKEEKHRYRDHEEERGRPRERSSYHREDDGEQWHAVSISGSTSSKRYADGDDGTEPQKNAVSQNTANAATGSSDSRSNSKPVFGIQLKLNSAKSAPSQPLIKKAAVFDDSDEEPEEMPREARMRMRNIGRNTPTSAGPNSYGKTKQGFCNVRKVFENTIMTDAESRENNV